MEEREQPLAGVGRSPGAAPREVSATYVRRHWGECLDRVARGREEIVVTRRGRPVARLLPVDPPRPRRGILGRLAGTATILGDIVEPIDVEWEANA